MPERQSPWKHIRSDEMTTDEAAKELGISPAYLYTLKHLAHRLTLPDPNGPRPSRGWGVPIRAWSRSDVHYEKLQREERKRKRAVNRRKRALRDLRRKHRDVRTNHDGKAPPV